MYFKMNRFTREYVSKRKKKTTSRETKVYQG